MTSKQVVEFVIRPDHPDFHHARSLSEDSRVIYNVVNSCLRARYFHKSNKKYADHIYDIPQSYGVDVSIDTGSWYSYTWVWEHVGKKLFHHLKDKNKIVLMGVKQAQQVIKSLCGDWASYWALWKKFKAGELTNKPNIPKYKKSFNGIVFNNQMINKSLVQKGKFKLSGLSKGFEIPKWLDKDCVESGRLVVNHDRSFGVELIYTTSNIVEQPCNCDIPKGSLVAAIDPGVNNLLTIVFSDYREAIIVDGKRLKGVNNDYKRKISTLQSALDVERECIRKKTGKKNIPKIPSKRIDSLWEKRERTLYHDYTTITNKVALMLYSTGVEYVVLGYNSGIKQRVNLGKKNNGDFVQIPIKKILDNLTWKLSKLGIKVIWTEESYTSKASFIDDDVMGVYGDGLLKVFSGKRKYRGLYVSKDGYYIQSDVNGAYNIMRKSVPWFHSRKSRKSGARDSVVYPARRIGLISPAV